MNMEATRNDRVEWFFQMCDEIHWDCLFVAGDPYLDSDAVFGVKSSLVVEFKPHDAGTAAGGIELNKPFLTVSYDFCLQAA